MIRCLHSLLATAVGLAIGGSTGFAVVANAQPPGGNPPKNLMKLAREPQLLKFLAQEPLQKELELTDSQRAQIAAIAVEYRKLEENPLGGADPGRLPPRERNELQRKLRDTESRLLARLDRALSTRQWERLWEIELQMRGIDILHDEAVVRKLVLSDRQRQEIVQVRVQARAEFDKQRQDVRRLAKGRDQKRLLEETRQRANLQLEQRVNDVLTSSQRATLQRLTGKPFNVWLLKGVKKPRLFQGPKPKPKLKSDV